MKNLAKANTLIEAVAKKYREITPITAKDQPLFTRFFKNEPHTYGNSWIYVTQGMYGIGSYGLGYKYYDGKNLSTVCIYPKIEQPNVYCFYWVRPMGQGILDVIAAFAKDLLKTESMPTYVKKIFENQFNYLHKKEFKDTLKFPWHSSCPSEDDTHPEQIYNVNRSLSLLTKPPRTSNIRKSYRKAMKIEKNNKVIISGENFERIAWQITVNFFNSDYIKNKKVNVSNETDYYNQIFDPLNKNAILRNIFYINNEPLGYYIAEQQDENYTSVYALITHRDKVEYLSDYIYFKLLEICKTPYLNVGGSEDEGIHNFKRKFKPASENQMKWAVYY